MRLLKPFLFVILVLSSIGMKGQFYNGSQMTFGKNRIQYSGYLWSHYNYRQFQVFFYEEGKNIADYVSRSGHLQVKEFERMFEHQLKTKIQFIVYNSLGQSRESNIGNYAYESGNTGGFARTMGNKVFLYFNGDHKDLDRQIRSGVARMLLQEVIYGDDYKEVLKNSALITMPTWYFEGLVSYMSEQWSIETEDEVKAYFKSGKFDKFNWLEGKEAVTAGHSLWYYIADKYGANSIANVLYMAKVNRSIENGFLFVLGSGTTNLLIDWADYFNQKILKDEKGRSLPQDKELLEKYKKNTVYNRYIINNKGDFAAFTTNELSQQKVWIKNLKNNEKTRVFKLGHKLDIEPDHSFLVIAWHPGGEVLSVFYEKKGELLWLTHNVKTEEEKIDKIVHLEKVLDASYDHTGNKLVLSAVKDGKTNIYVYDVRAHAHEQITDDFFDDRNPVFINNSKQIVFSSNRTNDTMKLAGRRNHVYQKKTDLFMYDYGKKPAYKFSNQVLRRITNTPHENEKQPLSIGKNKLLYLSDNNGIVNQWQAKLDSAVSFVDTAVHYYYFSKTKPLSNYTKSVLWHSVNAKKQISMVFRNQLTYQLQNKNYNQIGTGVIRLKPTIFKLKSILSDTVQEVKPEPLKVLSLDSIRDKIKDNPDYIYTDYYMFSDELKGEKDSVIMVSHSLKEKSFTPLRINGFPVSDSIAGKAKMRNYELTFRAKEVGVQLDNRFLNPQYQRYTGGGTYPNPGMNGFMKYGIIDLLEDYSVIGGFRIGDFYSNEVFLSINDNKKRLDKQYLFYRNTHLDLGTEVYNRNVTYEGIYRLSYPFSMVDRLAATFSVRYDQFLPLSVNKDLLNQDVVHEFWPNIRLDYTFDNTRNLGLNLYSGLRFKVFSEYYQHAPEWDKQMVTFGADFRNYTKIHRNLIWANRIAGGTSWGSQRLMFYMGGVDSWLSQKFNSDLAPGKLRPASSYAFQTLATNMRGFEQNIRNGTSFVALNSEIRWPIIKYFIPRPLSSSLLNNFQVILFGDLGTAWTGITPFSDDNSLNEKDIVIGGQAATGTVHLQTHKEPIVGGYGAGMRTKLWGYFIRADWAWGVEDGVNQGSQFYLSLTTDF